MPGRAGRAKPLGEAHGIRFVDDWVEELMATYDIHLIGEQRLTLTEVPLRAAMNRAVGAGTTRTTSVTNRKGKRHGG